MSDLEDVQRLAATFPGVVEGVRYGHRAWTIAGNVFASERPFTRADVKRFAENPVPSGPILALATDGLGDKAALLQVHQDYLFTISHLDNYAAVLLQLERADETSLREAMQDAWLVHAPGDIAQRFLDQER